MVCCGNGSANMDTATMSGSPVRGIITRLLLDETDERDGEAQPDSDRDLDLAMMVLGKMMGAARSCLNPSRVALFVITSHDLFGQVQI